MTQLRVVGGTDHQSNTDAVHFLQRAAAALRASAKQQLEAAEILDMAIDLSAVTDGGLEPRRARAVCVDTDEDCA